ncbi:MAG TPA: protein kinase [Pyrinomonadaceae bacterium]
MITHDRWQQIKEIFYSALDHPPADRSAFLKEVCGNDTEMLEEVEALLTADAENGDFLVETVYELTEGMLADEPREFSVGQEVGQYKIEGFISSGGMGQIYEAHDTKLDRKIALKFISPEYAKDPRRVQRFEQEARAASALNHPHVCVIHDVGVTDNNRHYIAMEFIQGTTLRDELARRTFRPLEALNIIIQVGDALASAHAMGIVHRDIKPENIMLRHDGYVKVVDFGLAKLTEVLPEQRHISKANTTLTEQHTIMGTVRYMSPEQLKEAPVDERTDIWSLGVVLYEMLTGVAPFKARAPNESIALILSSQPKFDEDIPVQLRDIIKKALEKDCGQRYQTITKLTADLRSRKRALEDNDDSYINPVPELEPRTIFDDSTIITRLKSQAASTADSLFGEIKTYKTATVFAATFALILLLLLFIPRSDPHPNPFQNLSMEPLTDAGNSVFAAISSDGKWVAHAEQQNEKQYLTLTKAPSPRKLTVTLPENVKYLGISFSPDNNYLYVTRTEKDNNDGILYQLALSGSELKKVKERVDSPISFSPQGDRFAFVRHNKTTTEFSLVLSDIDGSNEEVVARRRDGDTLSTYGVAWSPDGNMVVCPTGDWKKGWQVSLVGFDLNTRRERLIGNQSWFSMQQVAWYHDMTGLVVSATARQTFPHQLWWISFPDGTAQKITNDLSDYTTVSLADKKLITVQSDRQWKIWVTPIDDAARMTPIASGVGVYFGLSWTSKGKIAFSSMTPDRLNISQVDPDGSNPVQLTANAGDNFMPASSPDGRFIVFVSNRDGFFNIWRMNADDGGDPTQLTFTDGNFYPSVSPDNQWVAYDNLVRSTTIISKVPLAGGEPGTVGAKYRMPVFSPDNQFIAGRYDLFSGSRDVAIFPAQGGGPPVRHFNVPVQEWQSIKWLSNNVMSYVKNVDGYSNIWTLDFDTGVEKQITHFNTDQIYAYAWSPDYKQIACLRGNRAPTVTTMK